MTSLKGPKNQRIVHTATSPAKENPYMLEIQGHVEVFFGGPGGIRNLKVAPDVTEALSEVPGNTLLFMVFR